MQASEGGREVRDDDLLSIKAEAETGGLVTGHDALLLIEEIERLQWADHVPTLQVPSGGVTVEGPLKEPLLLLPERPSTASLLHGTEFDGMFRPDLRVVEP